MFLERPLEPQFVSVASKYTSQPNCELLEGPQLYDMMLTLNKKQRQCVMFVRKWCKDTVIRMKRGEEIQPYNIFLSGPGKE